MRAILAAAAALGVCGCVTATPTQSGFLTRYDALSAPEQDGAATLRLYRDEAGLTPVARIALQPAVLQPDVEAAWGRDALAPLLAELDAELCQELAERFEITDDPTALQVRAAVTAVTRTGQASSLFSAAASRAIPGPGSVRLPIGLGGLSAEAEVTDPVTGEVLAQLTWARRAQIALDAGSLSPIGDAHQMAEPFADAVGRLLTVEGQEPAAARNPELCPGFEAGDAGRFVAERVTGLHFVPTGPEEPPAP